MRIGLHTGILAAVAWGLLCTAFVFSAAPQLIRLMGAKPEVVPLGVDYLRAGSIGFPPLMLLYAISGSLRGMGNTWMPMVILIIVNAVNALVTFLLISGAVADLGVEASGIGYASAAFTGGALALLLASSGLAPVRMDWLRLLRIEPSAFGRLLRIGLPVGLEEAQFMLAFLVYTRIIARLGTDQLAAHSLALRSVEMAILPGFALATAATTLVSRYLGAGRPDMAEEVGWRAVSFALGVLGVMAVVQFAMAPRIVRIFVDDPEVVDTGGKLLRVFAVALPALAVHSSLSGALRGAGDVRFVLGTFTVSAWGIRVPIAALTVIALGLTAPFAWLAAVTENWTRAALVVWRYRSGRWKHLRV
jgi:putative MATE family efflux protein